MKLTAHLRLFLCAFSTIGHLASGSTPSNNTLYLLSQAPFSGTSFKTRYPGPGAQGIVPALHLAVEEINNRSDILSGYELRFLSGNSGCALESLATESFVRDALDGERNVVGVIGPLCSTAATAIAGLVGRDPLSLLQLAFATSPVLSSPRFGNTIKAHSTSRLFVDVFLEIMKRNEWNRVGAVYETERIFFTTSYEAFQKGIIRSGYSISSMFIGKSLTFSLDQFRGLQSRIIVVFAASDLASRLVCLAHPKYMDLTHPSYLFFYPDKEPRYLSTGISFTDEGTSYRCSDAEMEESIKESVFTSIRIQRKDDSENLNQLLVSGLTYAEYTTELIERFSSQTMDVYVSAYYDAIWSFALALNKSIEILEHAGQHLSDYRWGDYNSTTIIKQQMLGLDFEGASGRIDFNSTTLEGEPIIDLVRASLDIDSNLSSQAIGFYNTPERKLELVNGTQFIADEFPTDIVNIHWIFGIVMVLFVLLILLVTMFLHGMTFIYRQRRSVMATSPALNHLIFSGCYLFLVAILSLCFSTSFYSHANSSLLYSLSCSIISWCVPIGFSLIYGTICVKTLRIYLLFHSMKRHQSGLLFNEVLALFVVILILFDVVISVTWNAVDPWIMSEDIEVFQDGILVRNSCKCDHFIIWAVILALYKLTLTFVVITLSILTRRVDREDFKFSKSINILSYSLALPYTVGIPVGLLFYTSQIYISFVVLSFVFFTSIMLCHVFLFLPPLIPIFRKLWRSWKLIYTS